MRKAITDELCDTCGLIVNAEYGERQKSCPRCDWRGYDYRPGKYRRRYSFGQAQQILREATNTNSPLWHEIRRLAVAHLQDRGAEEIGSSDVSCVAIEFIQNETVVIENGKIVKNETGGIG